MALTSPHRVVVTDTDRRVLAARSRSQRCAHREVLRARIVLAAAEDTSNAEIARRLGVCVDTVRKWRARFCARGLPGLADRPRPGRRRTFPKTAEAEVKALACELPAQTGFRCPAGAARSWPPRRSPAAWSRRSRPRRSAAGYAPMPSARGGTGPGSSP
ncbi:MAG: helix-turn-helix domain-containing protein [Actinomycetota bacterium]|nr:helix-turn-helix domain-containing protein [Actinomycetota bacterium]